MPRITNLGLIKIELYFRDHLPPHFRAIYGEERALIEIESFIVYAGYLPAQQLKEVMEWASQPGIQEKLLRTFNEYSPGARAKQ